MKLNPHMTPGPGIEPETHSTSWEASAFITSPSLLPINNWNAWRVNSLFECLSLSYQSVLLFFCYREFMSSRNVLIY